MIIYYLFETFLFISIITQNFKFKTQEPHFALTTEKTQFLPFLILFFTII